MAFIGPIEQCDFGRGYIEARRHRNPDNTLGGYIANTAYAGPRTYIGFDAVVFGLAIIDDNAQVFGFARIGGYARIREQACVFDKAEIVGHVEICGEACVYGGRFINDFSVINGTAHLF